jgi:plastocyanin
VIVHRIHERDEVPMRRFLLIFVLACGGGSSSSSNSSTNPTLVVQATGAHSLAIAPGGMLQLVAYQRDADPYGGGGLQPVSAAWSSSNTAVATVDQNGLVTAVADGTATITASAGGATGTATVTVGTVPAATTIEWNLGAETSPVTTTVAAGTPVRWHASDTSHTVVADSTPPPDSVAVNQGTTTAAQTITAKGTYHYHCSIHPNMKGTLAVQ